MSVLGCWAFVHPEKKRIALAVGACHGVSKIFADQSDHTETSKAYTNVKNVWNNGCHNAKANENFLI